MKRTLSLLLVVVALVSAACGRGNDPTMGGGGDSSGAEHNEADVSFAQGMIPHHEQAIEMSDMILERGADSDVKALAEDIKAAQGPEIETMRGWLEDWGEKESAAHDMGDAEGTMMTDEEMGNLEKASGADLDKMFLEMMTRHHEGAIVMAETEIKEGKFPPAKELAKNIRDTQQAEITEMKDLLTKLNR